MKKGCVVMVLGMGLLIWAQPNFNEVEIQSIRAGGNIHMLTGSGGNIGMCAGKDGVFLVDDQFAPLTDKIRAAVAKIEKGEIRFLLNTHWHFDHTGGNENLGRGGTVIVAHAKVRERMSKEGFIEALGYRTEPSPPIALPVVTFTSDLSFHLNGEEIRVFHVQNAHTDGDAIVHFVTSDVIHMGDIFFNGLYPFIDTSSGGSIHGVIQAVDRVLTMVKAETKIIPGHGPLATAGELRGYRDMLVKVRNAVATLVEAGKTREETVAAKPTGPFDESLGKGFLTPEQFVSILHTDLSR